MPYDLGVDVGPIAVKTVCLEAGREPVAVSYDYCRGRPFHALHDRLARILEERGSPRLAAFTGSGGRRASELLGGQFVNEVVSQSTAVIALYPEARSIIEMGGEDAKLIQLRATDGRVELHDFSMTGMCAAGTGSFLDQQARRMGVAIEGEFGELALKSAHPPRIAGRCSVFAKSDMIHLQQLATPLEDIVAGLCFAVARNFRSNVARGRDLERPVVFQGGVAANAGMVRAFREVFGLEPGELIVPRHHAAMGALGAILHLLDRDGSASTFEGLEELERYLASASTDGDHLELLRDPGTKADKTVRFLPPAQGRLPVSLGIDVGSLSTNVVLIDDEDNVVARRYLPTASKPLDAIRRGLAEIREEVGDRVEVKAVGTTGSGRYLTGDFVGADLIQNEITAQATAAIAYDPRVDTIFEIGGQDSKFISIDNGVIVDFEMNKVCAAGTGSFLEEQAEKLGIRIEDFGALALSAPRPAALGDRCTVFMESDLNSRQQKGESTDNLVGGLAYSIVLNYIQKVVGTKRIGERIFFQGGVTNNRAVIAAFERITGKPIVVPPHFDVTGAIGAAMLARRHMEEAGIAATRFRGFDIATIPFTVDTFTCKACSNSCEIKRVRVQGEAKALTYGGRCERWELPERKGRGRGIPNLFEERAAMVLGDYRDEGAEDRSDSRPRVGIPRALMVYYGQFPFWRAFFEDLGFRVVLSRPTDKELVTRSLEMLAAETCFPVEVMHGHVRDLLDRGVDWVFAPFVVDAEAEQDNPTVNYNCPWVQTFPFMVRAALKGSGEEAKLLTPTLHFRYFDRAVRKDLPVFMRERLGVEERRTSRALDAALEAQQRYEERVRERGREVLAGLGGERLAAVVLGRPYNTLDPALNLRLIEKLINLEILPIPLDYLPLADERVYRDLPMICWPNGQRIAAGARVVARDGRLTAVYLGNFRCGPDSFLQHFVREEMGGKPYLQLEVDEHSADAGMITRLEAFVDSLRGWRREHGDSVPREPVLRRRDAVKADADRSRTLYFPYMSDGAYALAAASRSCGVDARVLPMQTAEDVRLGRKHLSGKECFPMICTTGSFLKKMLEPGFEPARSAFFMPDHRGPCRFGQYNRMQRIIFDRLGFGDVQIVAPSNADSYAGLSAGRGIRFRYAGLRGIIAVDMLRKLLQERRPYEAVPGETERVYRKWLDRIVEETERGARGLPALLGEAARELDAVERAREWRERRKPVIAVVGEIFMRDNPYCSAFMVRRLEALGAETVMAPMWEWLEISTLRYARDSRWKGDGMGVVKARVQELLASFLSRDVVKSVEGFADMEREVGVEEMLERCEPYIHRDYDGDPAMAIGSAAVLADTGVSGVAAIQPFSCLPGTIVSSLSGSFRKDHDDMPWINVDYDGQEDTSIETRLQAFMHQAKEYARAHGLEAPRAVVARR